MAPSELGLRSQSALPSLALSGGCGHPILGSSSASVPEEWPARLDSPMVWTGATFSSDTAYTYVLNNAERQEIYAALKHFESLGLSGNEADVNNFPLPTVGGKLLKAAAEIHKGKGFFILRGLEPEKYSGEDNIVIFLGVSSYIGSKRGKQDDNGNMLSHVRNASLMEYQVDQRPIKDSNLQCAFHTDIFCDILALQTHSVAAKGGNHIVASAWTIYNELAATRPDLLAVLTEPKWSFDVRGRFCQKEPRAVLYNHNGHVIMHMLPEALLGVSDIPRAADQPPITDDAQVEALAAVQMLAAKHQLVLHSQPGDLTFINNHSLLHSREAFDDDVEAKKCRYLVRLWLKNEELAWKLPMPLQMGNQLVFDDEEIQEVWNVAPGPRLRYSLHERFSP